VQQFNEKTYIVFFTCRFLFIVGVVCNMSENIRICECNLCYVDSSPEPSIMQKSCISDVDEFNGDNGIF